MNYISKETFEAIRSKPNSIVLELPRHESEVIPEKPVTLEDLCTVINEKFGVEVTPGQLYNNSWQKPEQMYPIDMYGVHIIHLHCDVDPVFVVVKIWAVIK